MGPARNVPSLSLAGALEAQPFVLFVFYTVKNLSKAKA